VDEDLQADLEWRARKRAEADAAELRASHRGSDRDSDSDAALQSVSLTTKVPQCVLEERERNKPKPLEIVPGSEQSFEDFLLLSRKLETAESKNVYARYIEFLSQFNFHNC
jgi:hypothetical protein